MLVRAKCSISIIIGFEFNRLAHQLGFGFKAGERVVIKNQPRFVCRNDLFGRQRQRFRVHVGRVIQIGKRIKLGRGRREGRARGRKIVIGDDLPDRRQNVVH